jgi:hypothetical protein
MKAVIPCYQHRRQLKESLMFETQNMYFGSCLLGFHGDGLGWQLLLLLLLLADRNSPKLLWFTLQQQQYSIY